MGCLACYKHALQHGPEDAWGVLDTVPPSYGTCCLKGMLSRAAPERGGLRAGQRSVQSHSLWQVRFQSTSARRSSDHPDRQACPTRLLRPACSHAPRASQTLDGHHEVEFRVCVRVRPATGLGEAVFQDLERGPCRHILLGPAFPALRHCTSLGEAGEAALPTQLNRAGTRPRGVGAAGKVARLPCAGRRRRS